MIRIALPLALCSSPALAHTTALPHAHDPSGWSAVALALAVIAGVGALAWRMHVGEGARR